MGGLQGGVTELLQVVALNRCSGPIFPRHLINLTCQELLSKDAWSRAETRLQPIGGHRSYRYLAFGALPSDWGSGCVSGLTISED